MGMLHGVSILLELVATAVGVLIAIGKKKAYGWCLALTFAIYVFYDTAGYLSLSISQPVMHLLFFVATVSVVWAIWQIYTEK